MEDDLTWDQESRLITENASSSLVTPTKINGHLAITVERNFVKIGVIGSNPMVVSKQFELSLFNYLLSKYITIYC